MKDKHQLDISVLLREVHDERDACVKRVHACLQERAGITDGLAELELAFATTAGVFVVVDRSNSLDDQARRHDRVGRGRIPLATCAPHRARGAHLGGMPPRRRFSQVLGTRLFMNLQLDDDVLDIDHDVP